MDHRSGGCVGVGDLREIDADELEAERLGGVGGFDLEHRDVEGFVVEEAVEGPIAEGVGAAIEERARFVAVGWRRPVVIDGEFAGGAGGDSDGVRDHCGAGARVVVAAGDERIAEEPELAVGRQGDGEGAVGAEPSGIVGEIGEAPLP